MNFDYRESSTYVEQLNNLLEDQRYNFSNSRIVLFPSFVNLRSVKTIIEADALPISFGAQNVCAYESGAYTGEVSAMMLKKLKCTHVIVGHSERRQYFGETDDIIATKVKIALKYDLNPLICVGESSEIRRKGLEKEYISKQLTSIYQELALEDASRTLIAYEPLWAIGTGINATGEDIAEISQLIFSFLLERYDETTVKNIDILYGGSVNSKNSAQILSNMHITGVLVGGASLDVQEFSRIITTPNLR